MHHSKMRIFIVLVALVASAMASPYEEKQDKDDLVYNSALQSLDNTEINDADPSVDDEGEHAEEQELSDFGAALEDTTQQEYNDAEELAAPSEAPMAIEQSQAAPSEAPMAIEQSQESGFKKVYSFDMKNSRQRCPSGFKLNTYGSKRLCGRPHNRHGCASITVQVRGMRYNQVRGRVIAYQYSSPDGFNTGSDSIDGVYVDGISITYGRNPRKHVWTLGAGLFSYRKTSVSCPGTGYGHPQPAFVGNNYFCTSGNFATGWQRKLYDVPLWSTITGNCRHCNGRYNVPYFCAQLPQSTNQNLEIRVCGNQGIADEDIKIEAIELYIK